MEFNINWHTEKRKLSELNKLANNPRFISPIKEEELRNSLRKNGVFRGLLIDTDNIVLGGNQKLKILIEELGNEAEIEVSVPDRKLTEKERSEIILRDNEHEGEYDMDIIADEYAEAWNSIGLPDITKDMEDSELKPDTELNPELISDYGILAFRLERSTYMRALQLLANAVEKTESDNNEECIIKLLEEYE